MKNKESFCPLNLLLERTKNWKVFQSHEQIKHESFRAIIARICPKLGLDINSQRSVSRQSSANQSRAFSKKVPFNSPRAPDPLRRASRKTSSSKISRARITSFFKFFVFKTDGILNPFWERLSQRSSKSGESTKKPRCQYFVGFFYEAWERNFGENCLLIWDRNRRPSRWGTIRAETKRKGARDSSTELRENNQSKLGKSVDEKSYLRGVRGAT